MVNNANTTELFTIVTIDSSSNSRTSGIPIDYPFILYDTHNLFNVTSYQLSLGVQVTHIL